MQLPTNDIEQIAYNAQYGTGESMQSIGETSVRALALDLQAVFSEVSALKTAVARLRATTRTQHMASLRRMGENTATISDKVEVYVGQMSATVQENLTALLDQKLQETISDIRRNVLENRDNIIAHFNALQRDVLPRSVERNVANAAVPPQVARPKFERLRSQILGQNGVFKVSMSANDRAKYGQYISTLMKGNGVNYDYLDASKMPRNSFVSARKYMPSAIKTNKLWSQV